MPFGLTVLLLDHVRVGSHYIEEISFPYRSDVHGVQIVCNRVFTQRCSAHCCILFGGELKAV